MEYSSKLKIVLFYLFNKLII